MIHIRVVLEPRTPRILNIVEEIRSDRMTTEAPVSFPGFVDQRSTASAYLIRIRHLKARMMETTGMPANP